MGTAESTSPVPDIVRRQKRCNWRRRILRDWLLRPLGFRLIVKPRITGTEYIPSDGPTLLVMNHIGFPDPIVVMGAVTNRFVVPMSKVENLRNLFVGTLARLWGVYSVDRHNFDRKALTNTIDLLNAGHCILIAPEGTRQPQMIEVKEGFTYVATKTNAAIVPIGLEYTDKVSRNMKRLRRTRIEIRFGPAFRFKTGDQPRIPREIMRQMTDEAMYQLAQLVNPERRGYYHDLSNATTETLEFLPVEG